MLTQTQRFRKLNKQEKLRVLWLTQEYNKLKALKRKTERRMEEINKELDQFDAGRDK